MKSVDSDLVEGRESELYGILINDSLPDVLEGKDPDHLAWGIFYSKSARDVKERLLSDIAGKCTHHSLCEICYRLNLPRVVEATINRVNT